MISTIKNILTLTIILFATTTIFAQGAVASNYDQGFRLGFGINVAAPLDKAYDFGLGADARIQCDGIFF